MLLCPEYTDTSDWFTVFSLSLFLINDDPRKEKNAGSEQVRLNEVRSNDRSFSNERWCYHAAVISFVPFTTKFCSPLKQNQMG